MKKRFKILGLVFSSSIILAACDGNSEADKKDVQFGEIMNNGQKVSFIIDNQDDDVNYPTKDSYISSYIFSDDGKITVYNGNESSKLSDTQEKSDEDILKQAKEEDKKNFEDTKKENKESLEGYIDQNNSKIKSENIKQHVKERSSKENKSFQNDISKLENTEYKEPKERNLKIKVEEDETGNHASKERMYMIGNKFNEVKWQRGNDIEYINKPKDLKSLYYEFDQHGNPKEVYDDRYAYLTNGEGLTLATKVSDKVEKTSFDKPDSDFIDVVKEDE
ncbi:hypothetical protein CEQ12_00185 (plasmid) [Staphylococcus cohnii]|nr:hypothetical protein CEQ12_00185 [Staphylococcus cohnii]